MARCCQDAQPLSRSLQTQEAAHSTLRISIIDRGYHRNEDWDVKTATRRLWRARSFYQMSGDVCVWDGGWGGVYVFMASHHVYFQLLFDSRLDDRLVGESSRANGVSGLSEGNTSAILLTLTRLRSVWGSTMTSIHHPSIHPSPHQPPDARVSPVPAAPGCRTRGSSSPSGSLFRKPPPAPVYSRPCPLPL